MTIQQRPQLLLSVPNAQLVVEAISPVQAPSEFTFRLEAGTTAVPVSNVLQRVELFDFVSRQWVVVDERSPTSDDSVVDVLISANASRYVEAGTGRVMARAGWFDRGVATLNWSVRIDQTIWFLTW